MRIVVDVMGGDHGSEVVINGVKLALQAHSKITEVFLVGNQAEIETALSQSRFCDPRIKIVHATEVLTMQDEPVLGLRRKKDCSIARAVNLVKEGKAEAVISPGNTGGILTAAKLKLGTLPGIRRPGIATVIPAQRNEFVLLDSGANIECKPLHLAHYAVMGSVYSREILGYKQPRVGILNVGTEDIKGNELTLEAFKLCKQVELNFVGNVEGYDLFHDRVDVVICDGFVGNIVLKTVEALAKDMFGFLRAELRKTPLRRLGGLLARGTFGTIARRLDPDAYGGAPLLGLNASVMKAHGSSRERAIMNAVRVTTEAIEHHINQIICREIAQANERLASAKLMTPEAAIA